MRGDDRSRFCGHCQRNVFDLSAMTRAEALVSIGDPNNRPCVRLYRRSDGRVMTEDCPVGLRERIWWRLRRRAGWLASLFAILSLQSCKTYSGGMGSEPYKEARYPLVSKEDAKKSKEVVVALFIDTTPEIGPEFAQCEETLATDLAKKFRDFSKDQGDKLTVIDPQRIKKYLSKTPNWLAMHPSHWGRDLGADYVIQIKLEKMSLYQPDSLNAIYEGQGDIEVDVYDVNSGPAEPKYNYVHVFKYPSTGVVDAAALPVGRFKQDCLEHLAAEIAMKHMRHKEPAGIGDYK
jgi:hypothetical protein